MRNRDSNPSRQEVDGGVQGLGRKDGELLSQGDKLQFGKMKNVLKMDGGDGCKPA